MRKYHFSLGKLLLVATSCLVLAACSGQVVKPKPILNTPVQTLTKPIKTPVDSKEVTSISTDVPTFVEEVAVTTTSPVENTLPVYRATSDHAALYQSLPSDIKRRLNLVGLARHGMSAFVQPVNASGPLLTVNAEVPRNPASVMKLLTTYSALGILGIDYQWPIEIYTQGEIRGNTLYGDLAIKGYGYPNFVTEDLESILQALQGQGLNHIQGGLIVDNSYFSTGWQDPGAFDNRPYRPYNAPPDATLINHRATRFVVKANASKKRVEVYSPFPASNIKIVNKIRFSRGRCRGKNQRVNMRILPKGDHTTVRFSGRYSSRCGRKSYYKVVSNPPSMINGGFRKIWKEMGGTIRGGFRVQPVSQQAKLFYTYTSESIADVIRKVNKKSNNVMARQLLLSIGARAYGAPGTVEKGQRAMKDWFRSQGLNFDELMVENGSGLSRVSQVSARHVGELLLKAWHTDGINMTLKDSLPIMGQDGTLRRRLRNSGIAGNAQMKTGTLKDTRAIAGYIDSNDGHTYVAVILHNDPRVKAKGRPVHDKLLEWVYWQDEMKNQKAGYASSDASPVLCRYGC